MAKKTTKKMEQRSDDVLTSVETQAKGVVANIEMLHKTILELRKRENFKQIERLNVAQSENFDRLNSLDSELCKEIREKYETNNEGVLVVKANKRVKKDSKKEIFNDALISAINNGVVISEEYNETKNTVDNVKVQTFENFETDENNEVYDVLSLPSNGQCYKSKKAKIAVSYLTATDENFITSPNLYKDGLITDCLLHRKIVDKSFDVDELCSGDADAILYFLRVTSYGPEFPATFTDPDTNQAFETIIDLSQIKVKDFTLIGDENGHFEYELPVSKDKIKFRFLTKKDERKLEKLNELNDNTVKAADLRNIIKYLDAFISDTSTSIEEDDRYKIEDAMEAFDSIASKIEMEHGLPINKLITNRLEMSVVSVNGNSNREYVRKYVNSMIAKDSLHLRRYILENAPGLDFKVKIEKPQSLGGGFVETFLDWNDTVFLSIS